jgi:hypothetical protein
MPAVGAECAEHLVSVPRTIVPATEGLFAADPAAPVRLVNSEGHSVIRMLFTHLHYIEAPSLHQLLSRKHQTVRAIRAFYADGTEMKFSLPWDPEVHKHDDGTRIGHAGVVPQRWPGDQPTRTENSARTRMWAVIKNIRLPDGRVEEQWHFQESLFQHTPTFDRWISENHFHNYGGSLFKWPDGSYARDEDGNYIMVFEAVTEERDHLPWKTEVFVTKINKSLTRNVGEVRKIFATERLSSPKRPYKFALRSGGKRGSLLEGGRPVAIGFRGQWRWVIALSGGDFWSKKYGVGFLVSAGSDPLGPYNPVLDADGELVDFATQLRCVLNGKWGPGRATIFHDHSGKLWMAVHFKEKFDPTLSDNRQTAFVPVKIKVLKNRFDFSLDALDADPSIRKQIRRCTGSAAPFRAANFVTNIQKNTLIPRH